MLSVLVEGDDHNEPIADAVRAPPLLLEQRQQAGGALVLVFAGARLRAQVRLLQQREVEGELPVLAEEAPREQLVDLAPHPLEVGEQVSLGWHRLER